MELGELMKNNIPSFLKELKNQLFNHGWAEEYRECWECNDTYELLKSIAVQGDVNGVLNRSGWDEEFDLRYDDGGISSFLIDVVKLMHKYKLMPSVPISIKEAKPRVHHQYKVSCPHCSLVNSQTFPFKHGEVVNCLKCEGKIKIHSSEHSEGK